MRIPRRRPIYPMGDNEAFYFGTDNDVNVYWNGTYLTFVGVNAELSFSFATATETHIYGGNTSSDDLILHANTIDATPYFKLPGTGSAVLYVPAGQSFYVADAAIAAFRMVYVTADAHYMLQSVIDAKDLYLATTGTGVIKFGVYTAGAALASDGYITIKDAAGNTRKLMVQA